jgi:hypothetical protein
VSPVKYELGFYIPEDDILHSHRRENHKSYILPLCSPQIPRERRCYTTGLPSVVLHPQPLGYLRLRTIVFTRTDAAGIKLAHALC